MVNGSSIAEFKIEKGLRQGDSLSPLLFKIVVEGLGVLFNRAKEGGPIKSVKIGQNGLCLTHLL